MTLTGTGKPPAAAARPLDLSLRFGHSGAAGRPAPGPRAGVANRAPLPFPIREDAG